MNKEKHFAIPPPSQEKNFSFGLGNLDAERIDFYNNVFYLFPIIDCDPLLTLTLSKEEIKNEEKEHHFEKKKKKEKKEKEFEKI